MLAGRDPDRLKQAAAEVGARDTAAFDATDQAALERLLRRPAGTGRPRAGHRPAARTTRRWPSWISTGRSSIGTTTSGCLSPWPSRPSAGCGPAARCCSWPAPAAAGGRPGCRSSRRTPPRCPPWSPTWRSRSRRSGSTSSRPASSTRPLSATLLGADLDQRRDQLRATLPIRRVVEPADVAALAVHLMTNTALTGATYDIDGGQQLLPGE